MHPQTLAQNLANLALNAALQSLLATSSWWLGCETEVDFRLRPDRGSAVTVSVTALRRPQLRCNNADVHPDVVWRRFRWFMPLGMHTAARKGRLAAQRAQEWDHSSSCASKYRALLADTISTLEIKQDGQWSDARAALLQRLQERSAGLPFGQAQSAAQATAGDEGRSERARKHAATMRMVKARHRTLVREIQASRKEASAAKQVLAKRRQAVFQADRVKANRMTRQLNRQTQAERDRQTSWHAAQVEKRTPAACSESDHRMTEVPSSGLSGVENARCIPHVVKRNFNQGADGQGASTQELATRHEHLAADRKAAEAATRARDRELAEARHRKALAEVQRTAAKPEIEAKLEGMQQQRTSELVQQLAVHQQEALPGSRAGASNTSLQTAFEQHLRLPEPRRSAQTSHPVRDRRQRVRAATGVKKVQLGHQRGKQQAERTSQWHPVTAVLPPPGPLTSEAFEAALNRRVAAPEHARQHRAPAARVADVELPDALPPGFFAQDDTEEAQATAASSGEGDELPPNGPRSSAGHSKSEDLRGEMRRISEQLGLVC
jgi:hypothetical protein